MSIAQQVVSHLPYLRRYARALTGSQQSGDAYVIAVLEALVEETTGFDRTLSSRATLYRMFTKVWNSVSLNNSGDAEPAGAADRRLDAMTPLSRQAFLLASMERFNERDAAAILGCTVVEFQALISKANQEIAAQVATNVLIIEDEPLIAMDLEMIMEEIGHHVVGIARTHSEAIEIARDKNIGLILADIQLADGSSGIDAANELLSSMDVPVIFITAFPERLLTGQRPEPTYLITKPYEGALIAGLSSQALFFGEKIAKTA